MLNIVDSGAHMKDRKWKMMIVCGIGNGWGRSLEYEWAWSQRRYWLACQYSGRPFGRRRLNSAAGTAADGEKACCAEQG
jgi:hypothetical protein